MRRGQCLTLMATPSDPCECSLSGSGRRNERKGGRSGRRSGRVTRFSERRRADLSFAGRPAPTARTLARTHARTHAHTHTHTYSHAHSHAVTDCQSRGGVLAPVTIIFIHYPVNLHLGKDSVSTESFLIDWFPISSWAPCFSLICGALRQRLFRPLCPRLGRRHNGSDSWTGGRAGPDGPESPVKVFALKGRAFNRGSYSGSQWAGREKWCLVRGDTAACLCRGSLRRAVPFCQWLWLGQFKKGSDSNQGL